MPDTAILSPANGLSAPKKPRNKLLVGAGIGAGAVAVLVVGIAVGGAGRGNVPASAEAPLVVETPAAQESAEPTPPAPAASVAAEPVPVADQPVAVVADPVAFRAQANSHLDDMNKDLDDLVVTVAEDGFWRLLSNYAELSFNYGQLGALDVPGSVAEPWSGSLTAIDTSLDGLSDTVSTEDGPSILAAVEAVRAQVEAARVVVNSAT